MGNGLSVVYVVTYSFICIETQDFASKYHVISRYGSIGIVQKTFEIRLDLRCTYNHRNVEESGFRRSVCLSCCSVS